MEDGKKEIRLVNGKKFLWDKRNKTIEVQLPPPPPLPLPPPLPFLFAQGHAEKFSSDRSSGGGPQGEVGHADRNCNRETGSSETAQGEGVCGPSMGMGSDAAAQAKPSPAGR